MGDQIRRHGCRRNQIPDILWAHKVPVGIEELSYHRELTRETIFRQGGGTTYAMGRRGSLGLERDSRNRRGGIDSTSIRVDGSCKAKAFPDITFMERISSHERLSSQTSNGNGGDAQMASPERGPSPETDPAQEQEHCDALPPPGYPYPPWVQGAGAYPWSGCIGD